ncbi:MAG: glycosyltransferase [Microgenomates group bacterium]
MHRPQLLVICHVNLGTSLSGGDRIFLNIIKYWRKYYHISALASPEAINLINRNKLHPQIISTTKLPTISRLTTFNLFIHHSLRFITGIIFCLTHQSILKKAQYIYTSSDFYGDFIFGLIAKLVNPAIVWFCGYYLMAPKPTNPNSPYIINKYPLRGYIYYLAQIPTIFFAKKYADHLFVTSEPDVKVFKNSHLPISKIHIIQGGVYLPTPQQLSTMLPPRERQYDAFFLGRLHSQKGIIEMVEIWRLVVNKYPTAKLVIIGDGELMIQMLQKISKLKLKNNITIIGFLIGPEKFNIIKDSKIVIHPATYDSGGMAAAEAMAWGLPGVSFDLPALKTYYPIGMIKTPNLDIQKFADNIVLLLRDQKLYHHISQDALKLTRDVWGWAKRLDNIYSQIKVSR